MKNKTPKPEVIMQSFILAFCENAAELGCPKDKEVDMWFRYLSSKQQIAACQTLMAIMDNFYNNKRIEENPVMCNHANEVPHKCNCPENCYCKKHTCKKKK